MQKTSSKSEQKKIFWKKEVSGEVSHFWHCSATAQCCMGIGKAVRSSLKSLR